MDQKLQAIMQPLCFIFFKLTVSKKILVILFCIIKPCAGAHVTQHINKVYIRWWLHSHPVVLPTLLLLLYICRAFELLCCRLPPKSPASNANKVKQSMNSEIILSDVPIIPSSHASRKSSGALSEAPTNPNVTLYDKLGGPEALEAAVDLFYEKVLADERLKGFFEGTNMMRLVIKQVQQPLGIMFKMTFLNPHVFHIHSQPCNILFAASDFSFCQHVVLCSQPAQITAAGTAAPLQKSFVPFPEHMFLQFIHSPVGLCSQPHVSHCVITFCSVPSLCI